MTLLYNGLNPLPYTLNPVPWVQNRRDPTITDYQNFPLGTQWLNETTQQVFQLVSKGGPVGMPTYNQAIWALVTGGSGSLQGLNADNSVVAMPVAGIINTVGDGSTISTSAAGNTVTFSTTGSVATTYTASDATTATPSAGNLNLLGGTNIASTASGSTVHYGLTGQVAVANGGTGQASFTPYAPICGGTTSTNPLQSASSGISNIGYVLTSNGSSAVPTWQAPELGLMVTLTLTSSQVKNAHATPIVIVPAAGAGNVLFPTSVQARLNYGGTSAFVAGAGQTLAVLYGSASPSLAVQAVLANSQITATSDQITLVDSAAFQGMPSDCENAALVIGNSNVTEISGNAANDNTVEVILTYKLISI